MSIFFPDWQNNITNTFVPDLQDRVLLDSEWISWVATLDQVRDLMIDWLIISDITWLQTAIDLKLPSTNTKSQFDTACTDDNFAFLGQANTFTAVQWISENLLYVWGTWLSDTVWWNWKASIDVRNDTSGAIYRARVNQSNNYVIDYFNGTTWSNKLIVWNDWSLTVNWQNRTSWWTSFTVVFNQTVTHNCVGYYKQIWKQVFFEVHGQITDKLSASWLAAIALPISWVTTHSEIPINWICLSAWQNPVTQNKWQAVCFWWSAYFITWWWASWLSYASITNNDFRIMSWVYEAS